MYEKKIHYLIFPTVIFSSGSRPYKTLFIQARRRGGLDQTPVGTWQGSNSAFPIFCQSGSDSLLDTSENLAGTRTFNWRAPGIAPNPGDPGELEFR